MNIIAPLTPARLSEVKPGDLVYINMGRGRSLALVLKFINGNCLLAVLSPQADTSGPFTWLIDAEEDAFRVATDWTLELLDETSLPLEDRSFTTASGAIHVDNKGVWLHVRRRTTDNHNRSVTVNLQTFEYGEIGRHAVQHPHWRIWASEEHRTTPGRKPLFEFTATPS